MRHMQVAAVILAGVVVTAVIAAAQEFDFEAVRHDLFAGAAGDGTALQRAIAATEKALGENARNAQALAVHGFGTVLGGGLAFQQGEPARGGDMVSRGLAEMNQAVALAPADGLVRVLRGILFQQVSRQMPPPMQAPLVEDARSDFQFLFEAQKDVLDTLGTHRLGELLQALGDLNSRQGRIDEAARVYSLVQQKLPGTEYAARAGEWMQTRQPLPPARTACIGCHTGPR